MRQERRVENLNESEFFLRNLELENLPDKVKIGILTALELIHTRYEGRPEPEENLDYHNSRHTEQVIKRIYRILSAIKENNPEIVDDKLIELGCLAAAFHDTVQDWEPEQRDNGQIFRKRFAGVNEEKSADEAKHYMKARDLEAEDMKVQDAIEFMRANCFPEEDIEIVKEAILSTIFVPALKKQYLAKHGFSPEQPSLLGKMLPLADVATAGMDGPKAFIEEGNNLFREENLDIGRKVRKHVNITDFVGSNLTQRIVDWQKTQEGFVTFVHNLMMKSTEGLPEASRKGVDGLFKYLGSSIDQGRKIMEEEKNLSPAKLLEKIGYKFE